MKPCIVCGKQYQPTGHCSKYCSKDCKAEVWTKARKAKAISDWQVAKGIIKNPGVGTGHAQGRGAGHHSFKPDAPHRYRDFKKSACELCSSTKFLCVHHLNENHVNNSPANLQTVCKSCHQKTHGVAKNFGIATKEKLEQASQRMKVLNATLPRSNGRNTKVSHGN